MKLFRTVVEIPESQNKITHNDNIMILGSCFSENIGKKLLNYKFNVCVNPFGVLYNPFSIKQSLKIILENKFFTVNDLYKYNENWLSFYHDTEFSDENVDICLERINSSLKKAFEIFNKLDYLIITFGTAHVYEFIETGKIVSNCHKIPSKYYKKYLLEPDNIIKEYEKLLKKIFELKENLKIIFTISPVRYIRDGFEQNQLSKAILIYSVHKICEIFNKNVFYFPAYEIFMDELRDYRFYADDMIHPSEFAIDYLWERFMSTYFTNETKEIVEEIDKILKRLNHRPFKPNSKEYKNFVETTISEIKKLEKKYSFLNFNEEIGKLIEK